MRVAIPKPEAEEGQVAIRLNLQPLKDQFNLTAEEAMVVGTIMCSQVYGPLLTEQELLDKLNLNQSQWKPLKKSLQKKKIFATLHRGPTVPVVVWLNSFVVDISNRSFRNNVLERIPMVEYHAQIH